MNTIRLSCLEGEGVVTVGRKSFTICSTEAHKRLPLCPMSFSRNQLSLWMEPSLPLQLPFCRRMVQWLSWISGPPHSATIIEWNMLQVIQNVPSGIIPGTELKNSRKSSFPAQGRHDHVAALKADSRCEVVGQRWTGGEKWGSLGGKSNPVRQQPSHPLTKPQNCPSRKLWANRLKFEIL